MIAECLERLHQKLENSSLPSYSLASCYEYGDRIYKNAIQVTPLWEVKKYRREHGVAEPIDLGLSVKWASHNLGAPCQEQPGYYIGWGDTTCMNQSTYYEDYPVAGNISGTQLDPATVLWRETWRIPSTAEMLELMQSLQKELGMAIIMITHDLGVVAQMCDEVIVMYAGSICEQGTADEIFYNPKHEYTKGLMRSIPTLDSDGKKLEPITGTPIDLLNMPEGCPFAPRCDAAMKICLRQRCQRMQINENHQAACWVNVKELAEKEGGEAE